MKVGDKVFAWDKDKRYKGVEGTLIGDDGAGYLRYYVQDEHGNQIHWDHAEKIETTTKHTPMITEIYLKINGQSVFINYCEIDCEYSAELIETYNTEELTKILELLNHLNK